MNLVSCHFGPVNERQNASHLKDGSHTEHGDEVRRKAQMWLSATSLP